MCQYYFYMRISTKEKNENDKRKDQEQTFDRQKGILERAGYVLTEQNTFAERISGKTKAEEREQFDKMLSVLKENDYVIFTETSRFSRSYLSGMEMLDTLIFDKKVNVKFISNGIELFANEKFNPYTWYTISQMLLADELQRRIISYNTVNGLKRKKEQGVVLGKPKTITAEKEQQVIDLYASGKKMQDIVDLVGVSVASVCRIVRKEKEKNV
ncbi:MAG: recombinase family protein [Christensenellales bacterium]